MAITARILILVSLYQTDSIKLDKYVKQNEIVLVVFWATWCTSCVADFNLVIEEAKRHPKAKILMIAINNKDTDIRNFIQDKKIPSNMLIVTWKGKVPIKSLPTYRAYYRGKLLKQTTSLSELKRAYE